MCRKDAVSELAVYVTGMQYYSKCGARPCSVPNLIQGVFFMYQALYRKWRPQTFDDVVGQKHVTDTLKSELRLDRLSHAYLFTGTRGTGKTTCAKILAKAANCENPVDGNPCNRCPSCRGIDDGSILDVLEIDAASNNSVDNIRAIRDEAVYTPGSVKKRVYIIDEVHMLSTPAFNALLKIMEEPPEHLIFVLATTESHKIPATILSRCQSFTFKRISPADIAGRIECICTQEGIDITREAVDIISHMADGSVRDSLSLLDQCSSAGGTVDEGRVLDVLGLSGHETTIELLSHIADRDAGSALSLLNEIYNAGKDISAVMGELSALVRDILVSIVAPKSADELISGSYDRAILSSFASKLAPSRIIYILDSLQALLTKLSLCTSQRIDAELCLIMVCDDTLVPDMKAFASRLTRLEMAVNQGGSAPAAASAPLVSEASDDSPPWDVDEPDAPAAEVPVSPPAQELSGDWAEILALLKTQLTQIEYAHLSNASAVNVAMSGSEIAISFTDAIVNRVLNKPNVKEVIKNAAGHVLGRPVSVRIECGTAQAGGDKFSELLRLGDKFNNVKIK